MPKKRLTDAVSFRVNDRQRAFLEDLAEKNDLGLCEACRLAIDTAMQKIEL
jgi:hypothetical protein